jgi:phage terminase small subunit
MNIRLQKYKKNRITGMNRYNAALAAGYSLAVAKSHTDRLEEKLGSITDYFERAGLTDKKLANKLAELFEATKVIGYLHQYKKHLQLATIP